MNGHQVLQHAEAWLTEYLWRTLGALLILAVGCVSALVTNFLFQRQLRKRRTFDGKNQRAYMGIVSLAIWVITGILVLVVYGVAGPVIGLVVSLGLGLGIFADSMAGFRVLLLKTFEIGNLLEFKGDGLKGTVMEISLSGITLITAKRTQVFISNRKLLDNPVINHSTDLGGVQLSFKLVLGASTELDVVKQKTESIAAGLQGFEKGYSYKLLVTKIEPESITAFAQFFVSRGSEEDSSTTFLMKARSELLQGGVSVLSIEKVES